MGEKYPYLGPQDRGRGLRRIGLQHDLLDRAAHGQGHGVEAAVIDGDRLEVICSALAVDEGFGRALGSPDDDGIGCYTGHLDANREAVGLVDDCIHERPPNATGPSTPSKSYRKPCFEKRASARNFNSILPPLRKPCTIRTPVCPAARAKC